jgi:hypothetical protein
MDCNAQHNRSVVRCVNWINMAGFGIQQRDLTARMMKIWVPKQVAYSGLGAGNR